MSEVTVNQLEAQKAGMEMAVELRQAVQRLTKNPDFQRVIVKDFMNTECARYAQASADPALSDKSQKDSLAIAQASGHLKRYLSVCIQMGNQAEANLLEMDAALEEARVEEQDASLEE